MLGRADSGEGADGLATRSRMSRQGCARRETSRAARGDQMGNPKAARRSHSQILRNSRSESFDRIATLVDFGAHLLWSPPHSFAESLCSRLRAQGLVFCCACETMSQAYCCGTVTARDMLSRFIVLLLGMVGQPAIFVLLAFSSLQLRMLRNRNRAAIYRIFMTLTA